MPVAADRVAQIVGDDEQDVGLWLGVVSAALRLCGEDGTGEREERRDQGGRFLRRFVQHEPGLRAYARVMVPTWDAVDAVVQEACVVMWRKLDLPDSSDNFLPWVK